MTSILYKLWKLIPFSTKIQLLIMKLFNDQFLVGVTGIFFDDEDKILLFKHTYRNTDKWSLPGGYVKSKEHPKEGLEREVKEESGLVVSADTRLKLRTDRNSSRFDITYYGKFIGGVFKESKEVSGASFFEFEELPILPSDQLKFINKAIKDKNSTRKS